MTSTTAPLVIVTRGDLIESHHFGDLVVAGPDGVIEVLAGEADHEVYPRSALKPFQALGAVDQLEDLDRHPDPQQLAIMCASHDGSDDAQIAAALVLAEADLDESALRCPPDWPIDPLVTASLDAPTALSHNCSGKHAGMLWAHTAAGHDPARYLEADTVLQRRMARWLDDVFDRPPGGPAVDGCGAPAWRTSVGALAMGFARLGAGTHPTIVRVRDAMQTHPRLVGGRTLPDTMLMEADVRVLAKRGAEGVMGACITTPRLGTLGVAVKIHDRV